MGCLLSTILGIVGYFVTAVIVMIAAALFGFTFSWTLALGVYFVFWILKLIF